MATGLKEKEIKTGQQLLEFLLTLSKEDLEKQVEMEGCDCVGKMHAVEVDNESIFIKRSY